VIQDIITENDRNSFKIGDANLKKAVENLFGKSPNDAYLKSPTPWNDLYRTYNWPQVKRVLRVRDAKILSITSSPTVLATKKLANNSEKKGLFNTSISESVSNSTNTSWSNSNSIKVSQKFKYQIGFLGTEGGGETSFEYSHTWGQGGSESNSTTVGSTQGVQVSLDPGESVSAQLTASRGTMKIRITYEAYLIGNTAINYNPTYKGHHFWSLNIGGVMQAGGLKNLIQVVQDIEVGYYSNGQVTLDPV